MKIEGKWVRGEGITLVFLKVGDIVRDLGNYKRLFNPKQGEGAYRIVSVSPSIESRKVTFDCIFGWLTESELFELRQREPRLAP